MHHNLTKTLSLSNSKGSVSYIIQDLWYSNMCTRWVPWRLTNTKLCEMSFLPVCWHILDPRERHYPLQQMKPETVTKRQSMEWYNLSSSQKKKFSPCQNARLGSLSSETVKEGFLWMWCQQGKQSSSTPTSGQWQKWGSVSNEFGFTTIQQKSCFSMTVQGSTQVQSLGKPLKKKNFIVQPIATTSTLQSPIWSPAGCDPSYEETLWKNGV